MNFLKSVWGWIKSRPIISGIAAAVPVVVDVVVGGCMWLGPFAAFGPWSWVALPFVWALEALVTIIIARSCIGETITGTMAKTSLVAGLATWVAALVFSPLAGYFAWTAVGTAIGAVIGAVLWLRKMNVKEILKGAKPEVQNVVSGLETLSSKLATN